MKNKNNNGKNSKKINFDSLLQFFLSLYIAHYKPKNSTSYVSDNTGPLLRGCYRKKDIGPLHERQKLIVHAKVITHLAMVVHISKNFFEYIVNDP